MENNVMKPVAGSGEPFKHVNLCDVCKKNEMHGVYASSCGPVSFAYCMECGKKGAEPYGFLVAYISMAVDKGEDAKPENEKINPRYQSIIDATLEVSGKTRGEFYADVDLDIARFIEHEKRMMEEFDKRTCEAEESNDSDFSF